MATDYTGKGYWDKCLDVDLTTGKCTVSDRHMQYVEEYGGGRPLGMRLLWEFYKDRPGYDPMGEEAPVMFIAGPCTGSAIAFGSRYVVVNKSCSTQAKQSPYGATAGTIGYALCGGHFGPNLKWAGFDMVYITGKSSKKVLLKIEDNAAELVDANDFWGLDVPASQELAKNRYGVQFATAMFGPAAENSVRWAHVAGDTGRAAGRSAGAVSLATRGLKGLIAYGTQMPPIANMKAYLEKRQDYYNALYAWAGLPAFRRWGTFINCTTNGWNGYGAAKNHQWGESPYQVQAGIKYLHFDYLTRHRSCIGCITRCMKFGVVKTGKYKGTIYEGPDYEGGIMNGHNWLMKTGEELAYVAEYVESSGMDCITAGGVFGFVIEAIEKGFITDDQLGVKGLTWGAADAIHEVIEHCIYDHTLPFYDAMRRGMMPMVDWIVANNKKDYDEVYASTAQCKNQGFAAWWANGIPSMGVNYALSTRGACHMCGMSNGGASSVIRDMGVYCQFGSQGGVSGYAYYETLNNAMGRNLTAEQWLQIGTKCVMLERSFNVCEGFRAIDDIPSPRIWLKQTDSFGIDDVEPMQYPGNAKLTEESLKQTLKEWYATHGVDEVTGAPLRGKLQELGLDYVIPYLEKALEKTGHKLQ